jgi:8-oxo-dGTP pyrophosphatase MutT (NUDIX family)
MKPKRLISILLPIKVKSDSINVYLQRRSADARVLPSHFGFWGGGVEEGETIEQGLIRETKEELGIDLDIRAVELFNRYEFIGSIKNIFILSPEDGWENIHKIGEGDYGKWFDTEEALGRSDIILEDKVILNDLERKLLNKPIR